MDRKFLHEAGKNRLVFRFLVALSLLAYLLLSIGLVKTVLDGRKKLTPLTIESAIFIDPVGQDRILKVSGSGFDKNVRASLSYDTDNNRAIVGSLKTWSHLSEVIVRGNYAYLANQGRGFQVVDVSEPGNPRIVGSLATPGRAMGVCLLGDYALVADGPAGLQVVSIADPARPLLLGGVKTRGNAFAVDTLGNQVLVADARGVVAVSIKAPERPEILHRLDLQARGRHLLVRGRRVFLANDKEGVAILSYDRQGGFRLEQTLRTRGTAHYVACNDKWLLVGCGQEGVEVYDLKGAELEFLAEFDTPGFARGVAVSGNRIFVADNNFGVQIWDGEPRGTFRYINSINIPSLAWGVHPAKGYLFVAGGNEGLKIIDESLAFNLALPAMKVDGFAWGSTSDGNRLYLATGRAGVRVIEIEPSGELRGGAAIDTPGFARNLVLSKDRLFVADQKGGLVIIDTTKGDLSIEAVVPLSALAWSVSVSNGLACVALGSDGLAAVDVAEPRKPKVVGRLTGLGNIRDVVLLGDLAFVAAAEDGLWQISMKDPANPEVVGKVELPKHFQLFGNATALSIAKDKLLLANGRGGCQIFDVSDPAQPRYLSTLAAMGNITWAKGIGGLALILDVENGLLVVDLKDPQQPCVIASLGVPKAKSVEVVNGNAYVTLGGGGLKSVPLPVELNPMSTTNSREMTLRIPPMPLPGNYLLSVFRDGEHTEMAEPLTF